MMPARAAVGSPWLLSSVGSVEAGGDSVEVVVLVEEVVVVLVGAVVVVMDALVVVAPSAKSMNCFSEMPIGVRESLQAPLIVS